MPKHSYSAFDIIGPIMVGPSSSHTAGAVKIGQFARALFNKTPEKVTFVLHGSFGQVYKGHATDRALLGGIMKFHSKDLRIRQAFKIAKEKNIEYEFKIQDLGLGHHPNTVKIMLQADRRKMTVVGSSIGGGTIVITRIDDFEVNFESIAGKYSTIVVSHRDKIGAISSITNFITAHHINIAGIQSSRLSKGGKALAIINMDGELTLSKVLEMEKLPNIEFVRSLHKIN